MRALHCYSNWWFTSVINTPVNEMWQNNVWKACIQKIEKQLLHRSKLTILSLHRKCFVRIGRIAMQIQIGESIRCASVAFGDLKFAYIEIIIVSLFVGHCRVQMSIFRF